MGGRGTALDETREISYFNMMNSRQDKRDAGGLYEGVIGFDSIQDENWGEGRVMERVGLGVIGIECEDKKYKMRFQSKDADEEGYKTENRLQRSNNGGKEG